MAKKCDVCGVKRAVVYQRYTGRALCLDCFRRDMIERVKNEIEKWNMIEPGDRVMLALSGGKDSYFLLEAAVELIGSDKVFGLSIIEGIPGYNREDDVKKLVAIAKDLGVDVVVTSIREYIGHSLYETYIRAVRRGARHAACTYCGISRRRIMSYYARIYGANKVATGHNLDDEAQTAVVNFVRGDVLGLVKMHPLFRSVDDPEIAAPRIKLLRKIYEWETASYALLKGYPLQETECMFINMRPTLRAAVREALYKVEQERPGTLLRMMEALDHALAPLASQLKPEKLGRCKRCGEITSPKRSLCKLCEILDEAGIERPLYAKARPLRLKTLSVPEQPVLAEGEA